MDAMASQITSVSIVYSTVCSGADQRKHQSFASLPFVREIHRWPVNSPHKGPATRKMFPFDDVIISYLYCMILLYNVNHDNKAISIASIIAIVTLRPELFEETLFTKLGGHRQSQPPTQPSPSHLTPPHPHPTQQPTPSYSSHIANNIVADGLATQEAERASAIMLLV